MKRFFFIFLLLTLGNSALGNQALGNPTLGNQGLDKLTQAADLASSGDAFGEETASFLPVEQAYQVDIVTNSDSGELQLLWAIADGYYLYRERFEVSASQNGEALPLTVGFEPGIVKDDPYFGPTEIYYNSTALSLRGIPEGAFVLTIRSQGCADAGLCYPPRDQYFRIDGEGSITEISPAEHSRNQTASNSATPAPRPTTVEFSLGQYLLILVSAALGGAILNLMPCVFPVLGLKVLSFANAREGQPMQHGLVYSLGVVLSFIAVAAVLIALQQAGQAVGWGFQLQSPWFVAGLALLFFALGLNMLGMFELGGAFMNLGGELSQQRGYRGSFFTGVLATVVASPCTAPFMGTAIGFAASQPPAIALTVFASLGIGMALPVLLLTVFPRWLKRLPKPGNWMVVLRQFMAFPLLATAIWLAWVIGRQTGSNGMAAALCSWLLLGFALWLWARKPIGKLLAVICMITIPAVLAAGLNSPEQTRLRGSSGFDASQIERFRENGQAVFLDVTADWCITCAANENLVLNSEEIQQAFKDSNTVYLVADWTSYDPAITALLTDYGRNGVPLYLYFTAEPGARATILPQILSKTLVLNAIKQQ